jgi:hypothetical protein
VLGQLSVGGARAVRIEDAGHELRCLCALLTVDATARSNSREASNTPCVCQIPGASIRRVGPTLALRLATPCAKRPLRQGATSRGRPVLPAGFAQIPGRRQSDQGDGYAVACE